MDDFSKDLRKSPLLNYDELMRQHAEAMMSISEDMVPLSEQIRQVIREERIAADDDDENKGGYDPENDLKIVNDPEIKGQRRRAAARRLRDHKIPFKRRKPGRSKKK